MLIGSLVESFEFDHICNLTILSAWQVGNKTEKNIILKGE